MKREMRCPPMRVGAPAQPLAAVRVGTPEFWPAGASRCRRATLRERTLRNGLPLRTLLGEGTLAGAKRRRRAALRRCGSLICNKQTALRRVLDCRPTRPFALSFFVE